MSRCRKRSARPARDGWHRRQAFRAGAPSTLTASTVCAATGRPRPARCPGTGTVQRAMDGSDCRNASLLFAWNAELRMHAASVLGRLNERLRLRRPRRAGRHGRVTLCGRACFGSTRQRGMSERRNGPAPAGRSGRTSGLPWNSIGAAIAENHRGQRRPARASSISPIAARSYCPASAAINHSGSRSRRNSGVQAFMHFAARHADPGQALADGVDDAVGCRKEGIEEQIAAAQAEIVLVGHALSCARGLAARRHRAPCRPRARQSPTKK